MSEETPQKISTPNEIKEKVKKEITKEFPSGFVAKIQKVSLGMLLGSNLVSTELLDTVLGKKPEEIKGSGYPGILKTIDAVAKLAFVEPKIVDEVKNPEKEIILDDLSDDDKFFCFSYAMPVEKINLGKKKVS